MSDLHSDPPDRGTGAPDAYGADDGEFADYSDFDAPAYAEYAEYVDYSSDEADEADDPPRQDPLADEAMRLLSAVQGWARRSFGEASPDGHTGSDCQWCPLCQFVAVLRGDRPDVTERVAEAGTAVFSALRALMDAAAAPGSASHSGTSAEPPTEPRVQRIHLDDEPS